MAGPKPNAVQYSQCPSAAAEHIARRSGPVIITHTDHRYPHGLVHDRRHRSHRQPDFDTRSMVAAYVESGAVQAGIARTQPERRQHDEHPRKTNRRHRIQRSRGSAAGVFRTF